MSYVSERLAASLLSVTGTWEVAAVSDNISLSAASPPAAATASALTQGTHVSLGRPLRRTPGQVFATMLPDSKVTRRKIASSPMHAMRPTSFNCRYLNVAVSQ